MKLLIEIGVEELPAIPFLKELKNIRPKWQASLEEFGVKGDFDLDFTPRRIVIQADVPEFTPDLEIEHIGAPKQVALEGGEFSKAAISFAKKCGISTDELSFKEIKGKEVLYHKSISKGSQISQILPKAIASFISSLSFGKSMRWGNGEFEFIRPIRSLVCVLGEKSVDFELYGVSSAMSFYPHRSCGYEKIEFSSISEYFTLLEKNGIILNASQRRAKILSEFKDIEEKSGLKIELDDELLEEVVAITEYPTALLGGFEAEF